MRVTVFLGHVKKTPLTEACQLVLNSFTNTFLYLPA